MECIVIKSNYTCEDVSYRQKPHITVNIRVGYKKCVNTVERLRDSFQ